MIVSVKDSLKLFGVSVIICCAALVCTMFLNYALDLRLIDGATLADEAAAIYDAQLVTSKVVIILTGACLLLTAVVTLLFYVKRFVDSHKKDIGILKAIGYSDGKIAMRFVIFGLSVLAGAVIGYGLALAIMPSFYKVQNADGLLPDMKVNFYGEILVYFVILPFLVFSAIAVLYAFYKLKTPVLGLLKDNDMSSVKRIKEGKSDRPFLKGLAFATLKSKKSLAFFVWFSAFCFSALIQMGASMRDLASEMMEAMMMIIGIVLAVTTLIIAVATIVKSNEKTVAVMRAYGYTGAQCSRAILGGYRPFAYVGFALGTVYQYGLLKLMVEIVFKEIGAVPEYKFDFAVLAITSVAFVAAYEALVFMYSRRINGASLKRIMAE